MTTKHWLRWLFWEVFVPIKNAVKHYVTLIVGLFCCRAFTAGLQGLSIEMIFPF